MNINYTPELKKLAIGLIERGIEFRFENLYDGGIIYVDDNHWDAVCHDGSYGHSDGTLEIMGSYLVDEHKVGDTVEGYLTADEILSRLDKKGE